MQKYKVSGMTCGHCANSVTQALEALPAVERALVDLRQGQVVVEGSAEEQDIRKAVADAGYSVQERLST